MLRDSQEVSIDAVPFDSTQRTYVTKDGTTYKIDDGTSVIYSGVSGIMKGYRVFLGVDNVQVTLQEGDSLTIKDSKYFSGVETVTTVYTTPTNDIDVTYNAIDIQRMNATTGSGFLDISSSDITVSGMTVTVQPQRACIDGITVNAKDAVSLAIDNGLSQLRTDLIVLRKTQSTASADYFVKKGELGSTTPPALEQVSMGIYEIPVCSIRVNASQTTLELSNITDLRNYLTRERDKPTEDTGTGVNPLQSSTFVLTNTATTRTLSNGLWVGQEVKLFNSTASTITITDSLNTFEIPSQEVFTLTWNGSKWATLKYQINDIFLQLPFQKSPDYFDNGTWEDVTDLYEGAYFRALGGSSEAWEILQKEHLPEISGSINSLDNVTQGEGSFQKSTTFTNRGWGEGSDGFIMNFKASLMNYGTEENPIYIYTDDALKQHVNADNYGIRIWKKIAY